MTGHYRKTPIYQFSVSVNDTEMHELLDRRKREGNLSSYIRDCIRYYEQRSEHNPDVIQRLLKEVGAMRTKIDSWGPQISMEPFEEARDSNFDFGDLFD